MQLLFTARSTSYTLAYKVYRVIQEEKSIFWDVIVSVIVTQDGHMDTCLILNCYRDTSV